MGILRYTQYYIRYTCFMFGLSFGRDKARRVAIVDIGSASAAVGVLNIDPKSKSTLVAANRSFIPYEKRSKEQFAARMGDAVTEAITKAMQALAARKDDTRSPKEVFVFFRAPWIDARVVKISKTFDTETKITRLHIDALAKEAIDSKEKMLEAMVLRVEVNGYPTVDAIGKVGHLITLYALITTVDEELQASAQAYVSKALPQLKPIWRSHTRALLLCIREHPKHPRDCVVMDVSSEGTSILIIRDGILSTQVTFDVGIHSILDRLAKNALPEETLGLIHMLEREQCSGDACVVLKTSMEKVEQEMVREFGEQLAKLSVKARLPQDMLLFVHPDIAPWLSRFFSRLDFSQFTMPLKPFSVSELVPKDMQEWIQIDSAAPDVSLLLATSLVHIEAHDES